MGTNRGTKQNTADLGSWWTSAEACQVLGIKPRALRKRVEAGTMERRKVGRKSLYSLAGTHKRTGAPSNNRGTGAPKRGPQLHLVQHRGTGTSAAIAEAPDILPETMQDPDLVVRLMAQLTADLSKAREERGEALALGFMLADHRDTLAGELDAVKARLVSLASELKALPWYAYTRREKVLADITALSKN